MHEHVTLPIVAPSHTDAEAYLHALTEETERLSAHEDQHIRDVAVRAILLARQLRRADCEVRARLALVWVIFEVNAAEAREHLNEVLQQALTLKDPALTAHAHCLIARMAVANGEALLVETHARQALEHASIASHSLHTAHAHSLLAIAHILLGEQMQALVHHEEALSRMQPDWPPSIRAIILCEAGTSFSGIGRPHDAKTYLLEALRVAQAYDLRFTEIITRLNLGSAMLHLGEYEQGERTLQEGLRATLHRGDLQRWEGYLLNALAEHTIRLHQHDTALQQLKQALHIGHACEDASLIAETHLKLAELHEPTTHPHVVLTHLHAALDASRHAHLGSSAATAHQRLSRVYEGQADHGRALQHFRKYHELALKVQNEEAQRRAHFMVLQRELDLSREAAETQRQLNLQLEATNARLERANAHVTRQADQLARMVREDALTRIANRRHFMQVLTRHYASTKRQQEPLAVALIDADHFKQVNDRFGHPTGDQVLRLLARLLTRRTRDGDLIARIGGEEFALLLRGMHRDQALDVAERIRTAVSAHHWSCVAADLAVTVSIGVADATEVTSKECLLALADERLYQAKQHGRNCVA